MFKIATFQNTKNLLLAMVASLALAAGLALSSGVPVSAQDCNGTGNCDDETITEDSPTQSGAANANNGSTAVSGHCNVLNTGSAVGGAGGSAAGGPIVGDDNSQTVSAGNGGNASINQNANCDTTNVTRVTQVRQVAAAPRGAVSAGAGGAVESSSAASVVGLVGSALTMGAGLVLRRQFNA